VYSQLNTLATTTIIKTKLKNKNKKSDKKLKRHNKKLNYKKNNRKYDDLIENLSEHDKKYINTFNEDYNTPQNISIDYINKHNNTNIKTINTKNYNNNVSYWILDSGASINLTNQLNLLTNTKECHERIYLSNNQVVMTEYFRKFCGYINNHKIEIEEVYYTPNANKNLLSIYKMLQQNYKIVFNKHNDKSFAIIYNKNGERIINITSNDSNTFKLWILKEPLNFNNNNQNYNEINYSNLKYHDKISLWHRRLCHYDISHIKNKLLKLNMPNKCPTCMSSKLKNKPFKGSQNSRKSKYIFELIHMDLVGPVTESVYGNKYFLTIIDNFSNEQK